MEFWRWFFVFGNKLIKLKSLNWTTSFLWMQMSQNNNLFITYFTSNWISNIIIIILENLLLLFTYLFISTCMERESNKDIIFRFLSVFSPCFEDLIRYIIYYLVYLNRFSWERERERYSFLNKINLIIKLICIIVLESNWCFYKYNKIVNCVNYAYANLYIYSRVVLSSNLIWYKWKYVTYQ